MQEYFGFWLPRLKQWLRSTNGDLLWFPDLSLARAYRFNHPPLPIKYELRRILESGEPDLETEYESPAPPIPRKQTRKKKRGKPMKVDDAGIAFITECEGCELEPYKDQAGYLTVGVGHLLSGPEDPWNRTITQDESNVLLSDDIEPPEMVILEEVIVAVNQNQFNALASLIFNIGTGAFRDSTLLRVLNEGDYMAAADQFLVWNKITVDGEKVVSEGLDNRRKKERELFIEPWEPVEEPSRPLASDDPHSRI